MTQWIVATFQAQRMVPRGQTDRFLAGERVSPHFVEFSRPESRGRFSTLLSQEGDVGRRSPVFTKQHGSAAATGECSIWSRRLAVSSPAACSRQSVLVFIVWAMRRARAPYKPWPSRSCLCSYARLQAHCISAQYRVDASDSTCHDAS